MATLWYFVFLLVFQFFSSKAFKYGMPSCSLMNILYIFMKSPPMWLDELNENTSLNFFFSFVMKIRNSTTGKYCSLAFV